MKKIRIIAFFLFILLSGCALENQVTPSPIVNQVTEKTASPESTLPPTRQESCDLPDDAQQIKIEGRIIFQDEVGLYFHNPLNMENQIIPDTNDALALLVASSPDHKRIAFFDSSSESGGIISADGGRVEINTIGKIAGIFYGWQDNNNIIFVERSHSDGSIAILDIETGNIQEIVTNLHDVNFDAIPWYAGSSQPSVIFDSTLDKIIYLSYEVPSAGQPRLGYIMRDRETQKVLWAKESLDVNAQPKWSPDNASAAIVITSENEINDQIYIVNREGQEMQVLDANSSAVDLIEWSPDGKKISLAGNEVLAVYDFNSNQLQEYELHEGVARIVWSPTGNQIVTRGSLIDLSSGCVFTLKPNNFFGPLAWLVTAS